MANETAWPRHGKNLYVAPTSWVCGDVTIGDDVTIMHHVLVRGDVSRITIGNRVNLQDGTVVHTKTGVDLTIADDVAVGHRAIVHGTHVGPHTLIGMGAIVLDDCRVGRDCVIGAGAVLAPGTVIPDGKVVVGVPGRIIRDATREDMAYLDFVLSNYLRLGREHAAGRYPNLPANRDGHDVGR